MAEPRFNVYSFAKFVGDRPKHADAAGARVAILDRRQSDDGKWIYTISPDKGPGTFECVESELAIDDAARHETESQNPRRDAIARALARCVARLDEVLNPWGFVFESDGCHPAHGGPYASGAYVRDRTRISFSCRDTIDNIYYEHSFVTQHAFHREIERFVIGHAELMDNLGHLNDRHLIEVEEFPARIAARDHSDPVEALIHDLTFFASSALSEPSSDEFCGMFQRGSGSISIEY